MEDIYGPNVNLEPVGGLMEEDAKPLRPMAKIEEFVRQAAKPFRDMRWILNNTFLMIVTESDEIIIFDALLQVFQIQPKHEEQIKNQLFLEIGNTHRAHQEKRPKVFKILGHRNNVNFEGLPI